MAHEMELSKTFTSMVVTMISKFWTVRVGFEHHYQLYNGIPLMNG
jgi:hypothetical protein